MDLQQVRGVQVEFQDNPSSIPQKREIVFNSTEDELVNRKFLRLLKKGLFKGQTSRGSDVVE